MHYILDYIKKVEKCPPMYLGDWNLTNLSHQLNGMVYLQNLMDIKVSEEDPLIGFTDYVAELYNDQRTLNYRGLILAYSENEKEALKTFFKLFDDYIRIPAYKKNTFYKIFNDYSKRTDKNWVIFLENRTYFRDYRYGFDCGLTDREFFGLFQEYIQKNYGKPDINALHEHFMEIYEDESKAFDEIFKVLTEFLKLTVGEDYYCGE